MDLIKFIIDPGLDLYFKQFVANNILIIGAGVWLAARLAKVITPKWKGDDEFWDSIEKALSGVRQRKYKETK